MLGQMITHTDLISIWIEIILNPSGVWGGVMTENGPPCIEPRMTVLDVVSRCRATEAVFKRWDSRAGECICCQALFDTLRQVADRYGLDLDRLMAELNEVVNPIYTHSGR
jgi:hypothetical protein